MDDRSESRASKDMDSSTTTSKTAGTAKRPLTKPVGPRLSNLSRPTSASSARTSNTPSVLNKPPARPTISSRRQNPSVTSVATTTDGNSGRISVSSVEGKTSGDEVKRDGITAKPKRMSLASSTTSDRPTSARSTVPSTPVRGNTSSAAIARQSAATTSSRTVPSSAARTTAAISSRSRPLTTAGRNLGSLAERKRLSTIPASPAVKIGAEESENNKENGNEDVKSQVLSESEETHDEEERPTQSEAEDNVDRTQLQHELDQSRDQIVTLEEQVKILTAKINDLKQSVTEDSTTDQDNGALQQDYEAKIEQLASEHQATLESERDQTTKLKEELDQLNVLLKDETFRKGQIEAQLVELQQNLEETRENARRTLADLKADLQSKFEENEQLHKIQMDEFTTKLATANSELLTKQSEISNMGDDHARTLGNINNEVSRQSQVIKTLQEQISVFQQTKDEETAKKDTLITRLQNDIAELNDAQRLELENAALRLDDAQKLHISQLRTLQNQLDEAKHALEKDNTDGESKDSLKVQELGHALAVAQEELKTAKAAHVKRLEDLQMQLQKKDQEGSKQQTEHRQQIAALRTEVDSGKDAYEKALSESQQKADVHSSRIAQLEERIDHSESEHAEQIQSLESDLKQKHHNAMESLQKSHNDQIKMLESQSRSALEGLEGLEKAHAEKLKHVQSEAVAGHQANLEKVTLSHQTEVKDLKEQLQAANDMATSLRSMHVQALKDASDTSRRDHEAAINKVTKMHNVKAQTLESTVQNLQKQVEELKKGNRQDLEELKVRLHQEHRENVKQLESQSRSAASDLENAKLQVDSLKGILASVEKEADKKSEEDKSALRQIQFELEKAKSETAEHAKRIEELRKEQASSLDQMKATLNTSYQNKLDQSTKDHEVALAGLRGSLEVEHKSAIEKMQQDHSSRIENEKAQHKSMVEKLEHDSAKKLNELKDRLEAEAGVLDSMKKEASLKRDEIVMESQEAIESLKAEHDETTQKLQSQLQAAQQQLEDQDQSQKVKYLETQLSDKEALHHETKRNHLDALNRVKEEHAVEVSKLQADLNQQKKQILESSNVAKEQSSLQDKLEEAEKMIVDLKDQLNSTALEIESERSRAATSAAAIEQLKQTLDRARNEQAKQVPEAGISDQRSSSSGTNLKTPARMGLTASKWATADPVEEGTPSPASRTKPQLSVTAVPFHPSQSTISPHAQATHTSTPRSLSRRSSAQSLTSKSPNATTPTSKSHIHHPVRYTPASRTPSSKKSSPQAQLALIQENLRQLEDINDEFLEEHETLAKTLNRHGNVLDEYRDDERNQIAKAMGFKTPKRNGFRGHEEDKENVSVRDGDSDGQSGIVEVIEPDGDGY